MALSNLTADRQAYARPLVFAATMQTLKRSKDTVEILFVKTVGCLFEYLVISFNCIPFLYFS